MDLIQRVRKIITNPKEEWMVIDSEYSTPGQLFTTYLLPLALASAAASFIGYGFIGSNMFGMGGHATISHGMGRAITSFISVAISFYVTSNIVDLLAPSFQSEKNLNKYAQLVAYSTTPSLVGSLLAVIPSFAWIGMLFGFYGFYLIWTGLPVLKKTPDAQKGTYIIVVILVLAAVYIVVGIILATLMLPIFGLQAMMGMGA